MGNMKVEGELKANYDVVVIGAGLGGMTAANRLACAGHSVLLLEQHFQLGGLATWFTRKGHIFDVALHGFPVGMIKTCRKYWSREVADKIVQLKGVRFSNPQFDLMTTFTETDFTEKLVSEFKIPQETVDAFFETVRGMDYYDDQSMTTRELFDKFFPGREDVIRFLMEPITYANGSTLDEPAITYGIVFSNFMSKGVYTFEGGTDVFIGMLHDILIKNNVTIATKALCEKIHTENGCVTGVRVNGKNISTSAVMSNANIIDTIENLVGTDAFDAEFVKDTAEVRINNSSCQVYMGIKEGETLPYKGELLFTSSAPRFDAKALCSIDVTSRTYSVYYPECRPGSNRYTVVASTNANYEDWENFSDEEYKAAKDKLIKEAVEGLEKYFPGVGEKIDYTEAATPRTFKRYTLHRNGSSFGTKFEGLPVSMDLHKHLAGLFHAGSVGIIMSGWLGAANYGVIAANGVDSYLHSLNKE